MDSLRADGHSPVLLAASGATDYWYRETRGRSHPTLRDTSVLVGFLLALHIVQLLLEHGADPNIPEECAPEGRALWEACRANHFDVAKLLLDNGANPNSGVDSCECCLTIAEVYHGEKAKPLQELLRSHGAYWPPYRMDLEQLKQSIRDGSPAVHHDEFLSCAMQNCDPELLELLLSKAP